MCWFIWLRYSAAWFVSLCFHLRTDEINIIKLLKNIYISVKHVLMVFYIPVFPWHSKSKQNAWLFFRCFCERCGVWYSWYYHIIVIIIIVDVIIVIITGWKCWFIDTFTGNEEKINERNEWGTVTALQKAKFQIPLWL